MYTKNKALSLISLTILMQQNPISSISKQVIQKYLPENPIILEAGAYDGGDTRQMAALWPKSTIYAFEPIPELFNKMRVNTLNHLQIRRFKLALSDQNGEATFYVSSGMSDASSSLLKPKEHLNVCPTVKFNEIITVETITLDDWAEQNNVDHIDFMWLDMQGGEYQMLKASTKILPTVQVILTEVSYKELYEGCPNFPEFKAWMESQGFVLVDEDSSPGAWGDALFVRKK